jgi:hypothetical protein
MKLSTHLHLMPRSNLMQKYLRSPIRLHGRLIKLLHGQLSFYLYLFTYIFKNLRTVDHCHRYYITWKVVRLVIFLKRTWHKTQTALFVYRYFGFLLCRFCGFIASILSWTPGKKSQDSKCGVYDANISARTRFFFHTSFVSFLQFSFHQCSFYTTYNPPPHPSLRVDAVRSKPRYQWTVSLKI